MPAWTADLYFYEEGCISNDDEPSGVIPYDEVYQDESKEGVFSDYAEFPCWSVGRLLEIYEICFGGYFNSRYFGHTLMEDVLLKIEEQIDSIYFSKLEE